MVVVHSPAAPVCHLPAIHKKIFKQKPAGQSPACFVSKEHSDEGRGLKRKSKPKGVEVIVPHIEDITFVQICTPAGTTVLPLSNSSSSFLHCVNAKRGPPAA